MAPDSLTIRRRQGSGRWEAEKNDLERKIQRLEAQLNDKHKTIDLEKQLLILGIREDEQLKWQIQALEAQLNSKENKIGLLRDKLSGSEELLNEYSKTIDRLTSEVYVWRDKFYAQEEQMEDLEGRCVGLESEVKEKSERIEILSVKGHGGSVQEKYLKLIEEQAGRIKELQSKVSTQESRIKSAQESVFQLHKKARYDTMEDGEIRLLLENEVLEKMKDWARSWEAQESNFDKAGYESTDLLEAIQKVADVRKGHLREQLQGLIPRVIITALLSQYVRENVFQQPFHQLGSRSGNAKPSTGVGFSEMMMTLYNAFLQEREPEAQAWRSSTMQLLSKVKASEENDLKEVLEKSRNQYADDLAAAFLSGPVRYFLKSVGKSELRERKEKLGDLLRYSSDFSLSLWKQRVALELRGFEYYVNRPFQHNSPIMEAHRSLHLDDDDPSRDGEKVRMVVQPGFFARGNEDGERYDQAKVWAKAVVMIS